MDGPLPVSVTLSGSFSTITTFGGSVSGRRENLFFYSKNQSYSNYDYDCDSGSVERPPLETIVKYFFYDSYIT